MKPKLGQWQPLLDMLTRAQTVNGLFEEKVNGLFEDFTTTRDNRTLFPSLSWDATPKYTWFYYPRSLDGLVARAGNAHPVHTLHILAHPPHPSYIALAVSLCFEGVHST